MNAILPVGIRITTLPARIRLLPMYSLWLTEDLKGLLARGFRPDPPLDQLSRELFRGASCRSYCPVNAFSIPKYAGFLL